MKYRPEINTQVYKDWRRKVFRRDKGRCQMPNCGTTKSPQVHHIKKWSEASYLRYEVSNGISLCWNCHKEVTGKESLYEGLFMEIINGKNS